MQLRSDAPSIFQPLPRGNKIDRLTTTHNARQAEQRGRIKAFDTRLTRAEKFTRQIRRKRGVSHDTLIRDIRTADANGLSAASKHLANMSWADHHRAQALNEANAQHGIKGMPHKFLTNMQKNPEGTLPP